MATRFRQKHIFLGEIPAGVRLVENFRPRAVPVDFPAGFLRKVAFAIVGIREPYWGDFALGIRCSRC